MTPIQELIKQMSYNRDRALGAEKDAYSICILYAENMLEKLETLKTNKMKTLKLNFEKWCHGAKGGTIRRIYDRVYIKGYIWTPLVIVTWRKTKER